MEARATVRLEVAVAGGEDGTTPATRLRGGAVGADKAKRLDVLPSRSLLPLPPAGRHRAGLRHDDSCSELDDRRQEPSRRAGSFLLDVPLQGRTKRRKESSFFIAAPISSFISFSLFFSPRLMYDGSTCAYGKN